MKTPDIIPINGARRMSIWLRVQQYFHQNDVGWLKYLRENTSKKVVELDQKKNGSCTVFATLGAVMYNTDLTFTNEEVRKVAEDLGALEGAVLWDVVSKVANRLWLCYYAFSSIFDPEAQRILDLGYGLPCSVRFWVGFYQDWMVDGVVQEGYSDVKPFLHAMWIFKKGGEYYFVNAWGEYKKLGYHNIYKVDMERMKRDLKLNIRCYFLA